MVIKVEIKAGVDTAAGEDYWTVPDENNGVINYGEGHDYEVEVSQVILDTGKTAEEHGDAAYVKYTSNRRSYVTDAEISEAEDNTQGCGVFYIANYTPDSPGIPLPGTGGAGRTMLYVIGAIVLVGAGILLVSKRRMTIGV